MTTDMPQVPDYWESRLNGTRRYFLTPTQLRVTHQGSFGDSFDITLELVSIVPNYHRLRRRFHGFIPFAIMSAIGFGSSALWFAAFLTPPVRMFLGLLGIGLGIGFSLLAAYVGRKVEYAIFTNEVNINVLDISDAGRTSEQFAAFVEQVQRAIEQCRLDKSSALGKASVPSQPSK